MRQSSLIRGLAVRHGSKSQHSGSDPALVPIMVTRARRYPKLSRKAPVNSTLLSFDEASVSPATNSIIDF